MTAMALSADEALLVAHAIPTNTLVAGRYEVLAKLAEGTVATVYRARDTVSSGDVALKVFDPLRSADPIAQRRFEREMLALARVEHRGVARGLDLVAAHGLLVLVLEYIEGESLEARLQRGPLGVRKSLELALDLAEALEACHGAGIIHRDLKPSNVILHPDRGPVILDFGVAWLSSAMTLTRTGAIVGSPRYLAPETFAAASTDQRVDVFALGAILFEALTGRPLRTADTVAELASEANTIEAPTVSALVAGFPQALDGVVKKALAARPEHRYATARELAQSIRLRRAEVGRPLEALIACTRCQTALIVDLPICPGCGRDTDWALERGCFAVQLLEIPRPEAVARWIAQRYGDAARVRGFALIERLRRAPTTLALGASETTAEALAAQARELGCKTIVVRARAVLGPALQVPAASANEVLGAAAAHFAVVVLLGILFVLFGVYEWIDRLIPVIVAIAGTQAVLEYVRRPLLAISAKRAGEDRHPALDRIQQALSKLTDARTRMLAAAAIARATPLLLGDTRGLSINAHRDALEALDTALAAAEDVETHRALLESRSRSALRGDRIDAEARRDQPRLERLRAEEEALTEASIAHDLGVRRVLESCEAITAALSTRTNAVDVA